MKRIALCLNIDDPEQKELHDFITVLPNGKKRNASAFLKMLADREYQLKKKEYLADKMKRAEFKKTQDASLRKVITNKGGIKIDLTNKS